jgi:hypothetical protein
LTVVIIPIDERIEDGVGKGEKQQNNRRMEGRKLAGWRVFRDFEVPRY